MRSIKSIQFVFENCESFSIDVRYFGSFELSDFYTTINRFGCNCIAKINYVDTVVLEIFSEGNKKYAPFGFSDDVTTYFDRLRAYNDITRIEIVYSDNTSEEFYVDYEGDQFNKYQKSYTNKFGDLYIVISKDKDIFDFFDEDEINDKDVVTFNKNVILD